MTDDSFDKQKFDKRQKRRQSTLNRQKIRFCKQRACVIYCFSGYLNIKNMSGELEITLSSCRICFKEDETVVNRLSRLHKSIIYKIAQIQVIFFVLFKSHEK